MRQRPEPASKGLLLMKRAKMPTVSASAAPPLDWADDVVDLARPEVRFEHADSSAVTQLQPLPWYRRPGVLFGAAACAALLAATVLIATWRPDGVATPAVTTAVSTTVAVPAPLPPQLPATAPAPVTETVVVQQPTPGVARREQASQAPRLAPPPKAPPADPTAPEAIPPVITDPVSPYPGEIAIDPSDTIPVPPAPGRDSSIPDCSDLPPETLC